MNRRPLWLALLLAVFLMPACSEDDPAGPGGSSTGNFAGTWSITQTITAKTVCNDNQIGDTDSGEITITQTGTTVTIDTGNNTITLTASGNTATGQHVDGTDTEDITITVSGNSLTGTVVLTGDGCTQTTSITGTRQVAPVDGWDGYWDVTITVSTSNCEGEEPGDSFVQCMGIMTEGSFIALVEEDGTFEGTINGNTATLSREDQGGNEISIQITLGAGGTTFTGTATSTETDPACTSTYTLSAVKLPGECGGSSGGDWEGAWNITGAFTQNECEFSFTPTCDVITQDGNTLYFEGDELEFTVNGNSASYFEQVTEDGVTFTLEVQITLNGDTFTGFQSLSFSDGETGCTTTLQLTGNRVSSCVQAQGWMSQFTR